MSTNLDLKELERNAFRTNFQDGLWDIFLGLLLFQNVIDLLLYQRGWSPIPILLATLVYVILVLIGFRLLKKYVVIPRLGLVNFGPERQAKKRTLILILALSILLGVVVLVVAAAGYNIASSGSIPQLFNGGFIFLNLFTVVAVVVFSLAAYLFDFPRAYLYGWFFGLATPLNIWLSEQYVISFPLATAVFSAIMCLIGAVLLVRFISTHPLTPEGGGQ